MKKVAIFKPRHCNDYLSIIILIWNIIVQVTWEYDFFSFFLLGSRCVTFPLCLVHNTFDMSNFGLGEQLLIDDAIVLESKSSVFIKGLWDMAEFWRKKYRDVSPYTQGSLMNLLSDDTVFSESRKRDIHSNHIKYLKYRI